MSVSHTITRPVERGRQGRRSGDPKGLQKLIKNSFMHFRNLLGPGAVKYPGPALALDGPGHTILHCIWKCIASLLSHGIYYVFACSITVVVVDWSFVAIAHLGNSCCRTFYRNRFVFATLVTTSCRRGPLSQLTKFHRKKKQLLCQP